MIKNVGLRSLNQQHKNAPQINNSSPTLKEIEGADGRRTSLPELTAADPYPVTFMVIHPFLFMGPMTGSSTP